MAEQEEKRRRPADMEQEPPVSEQSRTGRAVALARLLHHECTHLLQLYKEKETLLVGLTPEGGRIVCLSPDAQEPSPEGQVQQLHSVLRQCLGLLHCVILKEEEEWGELEGDYENMRKNVRQRLEHLLVSTKDLVETEDVTLEVTPDHQCNEETDGAGGIFALKMWTYRVLEELIHWADHAAQTLHILHTQREGTADI